MCWFYVGQIVSTKDVAKWYTPEAITLLMSDGFLKVVSEIVPPKTLIQRYMDNGEIVHIFSDGSKMKGDKYIAGVDSYHAKLGDVDVVMVIDKKYL